MICGTKPLLKSPSRIDLTVLFFCLKKTPDAEKIFLLWEKSSRFGTCRKALHLIKPLHSHLHGLWHAGVIKTVRQSKPNSFDYTPGTLFATISNNILFQK